MRTKPNSFGLWALLSLAFASGSCQLCFETSNAAAVEPIYIESVAMNLDGLFALERIAAPALSPDGTRVLYQVTKVLNVKENQTQTQIWIANADGSGARQLTHTGKSNGSPRWSPDGKKILFESSRDGESQLYILDLDVPGEPVQLTSISTGASNGVWSPDGLRIAFISSVRPEFSSLPFPEADAKNREFDKSKAESTVKAKTFTRLMYRHWNRYLEDKRMHVFVIDVDGGNCRNVTPGDRNAHPVSSTFVGGDELCFSPDGQHVLFTAPEAANEGWSTNHDICRVAINNQDTQWQPVTAGPAAESNLVFSPDGTKVAYRAQARAGYEADRWQLIVGSCNPDGTISGTPASWTESLDASVNDFAWVSNEEIAFTSDLLGSSAWFLVNDQAKPKQLAAPFDAGRMGQLQGVSYQGRKFVVSRASLSEPASLYSGELPAFSAADADASAALSFAVNKIGNHNSGLLEAWERPVPESVSVPVEGGVEMQMWIMKPPAFDPAKKWPVVYMIHGGPQSAWNDGWSFRWNPLLWASQGYVVVLPNPRGSVGFGQKFCDEISGDWGGKCYRDLVTGLDYVKSLPYVDTSRLASAGASFGGYMQNWFAVNEIAKEFRCFINHCSVYNFDSMWGTTDELWFDEFEQGGTPWERPASYRQYSPSNFAGNLGKYKVPMLVIHNDLDFRCPIGQGHELFQALQRQGVESRFVNFPDEGHWVNKPANSLHWHNEVFGWLSKFAAPGGK